VDKEAQMVLGARVGEDKWIVFGVPTMWARYCRSAQRADEGAV